MRVSGKTVVFGGRQIRMSGAWARVIEREGERRLVLGADGYCQPGARARTFKERKAARLLHRLKSGELNPRGFYASCLIFTMRTRGRVQEKLMLNRVKAEKSLGADHARLLPINIQSRQYADSKEGILLAQMDADARLKTFLDAQCLRFDWPHAAPQEAAD